MQYDKLLNQVETAIRNTKVFVGLTTLEYVVRGGRVPASKKKIADLLHINPILSLSDSGIKAVGKSFGKKNILPKFKKFVEKSIDWNKPCRIGIAHTNNEEVALLWGNWSRELTSVNTEAETPGVQMYSACWDGNRLSWSS
jgi:fatty acid-binding protein DegV